MSEIRDMLQHLKTSWRFIADVKFINYNLLIKTICENLDRVGGRLDSVELKTVKGTDRWDVGGQWVCRWEQLEIIFYIIEKMGSREVRSCSSYRELELTLSTLTSECIFSILFPIHFLRFWKGEFVEQSGVLQLLIISLILMTLMFNLGVILWGEIRC